MAREIQLDFKELLEFFKNYNLNSIQFSGDLKNCLSYQHKKYFSYLIFIAEIGSQKSNHNPPLISESQLEFITESCSDIGNSLFLMVNGAYKPSKMMLRSSIETFLKGFVLDDIADIDKEKSVYDIFDRIKALTFFNIEVHKEIFESIHNTYKLLCEDIHTASKLNMANITALTYFPTNDIKKIENFTNTSTRLVCNYIDLLAFKYNSYFHHMHHRNKEIILENISREYRRQIMGID